MHKLFGIAAAACCAPFMVPAAHAADQQSEWVKQARAIAGTDLTDLVEQRCKPVAPAVPMRLPRPWERLPIAPTKVFDNVFFLGNTLVGVNIIRTSEGLILLDAMMTDEDVLYTILEGMKELELDPSQIKYIVVSHAHGDHHGGVRYLRELYPDIKVVMTATDWAFSKNRYTLPIGDPDLAPMLTQKPGDISYSGRSSLTLGDFTMELHETPGHTPGTQSFFYPASWQGKRFMVSQWGGAQPEAAVYTPEVIEAYFARAKELNVAARWSNHARGPVLDTLARLRAGAKENPLILGAERMRREMEITALCKRAFHGK